MITAVNCSSSQSATEGNCDLQMFHIIYFFPNRLMPETQRDRSGIRYRCFRRTPRNLFVRVKTKKLIHFPASPWMLSLQHYPPPPLLSTQFKINYCVGKYRVTVTWRGQVNYKSKIECVGWQMISWAFKCLGERKTGNEWTSRAAWEIRQTVSDMNK